MTTSTDTVVAEIKMGAHDGSLIDIADAIKLRAKFGAVGFRWKISLPDIGFEVTEDTITLDELAEVEKVTGVSWTVLRPAARANICLAILRATVANRTDMTADEANAYVGGLTADGVVSALSEYEVASPPLDPTLTTSD